MLGEDENPDRGPSLADDFGRAQSFVGVCGWHPDIDDRDIRLCPFDQREQSFRVGSEPDNLEAGFFEQAGEPFA